MYLQKPASSPGEPTKFGTGRGDRFQTNTENPLWRRCLAIPRPMIPSPTTPIFVCFGWDADAGRSMGGLFSDQPADKNGFTQFRIFAASPFQPEFGEIIQRDRADDLKTLCADFVDRIIGGVPRGVIEINDVDRRNPDRV